ncbi:MAG: ABC transporter ATP-binding protein, partial [Bacteroidetes bacterium]|nr:ABC transporter ATP-binding protein [Bacteroidota bacterium]
VDDYSLFALRDITFSVSQGETFGIIGKNGAGKTTLLKILSRVTGPSLGEVRMKGRVASLLEVGTGFHPDLTGRENIFLNGMILGMSRKEVRSKLDEIIDFSGVEKFIDTPVKRYSSGMSVRLAFSVAAHLEAEILLMDEVLAVGDAEFQKKCHGKMDAVSQQGRTILFVSHNLGAVASLCRKTLLLDKGRNVFCDETSRVIDRYLEGDNQHAGCWTRPGSTAKNCFTEIRILNTQNEVMTHFDFSEKPVLELTLNIIQPVKGAVIGFALENKYKNRIFTNEYPLSDFINAPGSVTINISIPARVLAPGRYGILLALHIPNQQLIDQVEDVLYFQVSDKNSELYRYHSVETGNVIIQCEWNSKTN